VRTGGSGSHVTVSCSASCIQAIPCRGARCWRHPALASATPGPHSIRLRASAHLKARRARRTIFPV
jgi:hypothetical protein